MDVEVIRERALALARALAPGARATHAATLARCTWALVVHALELARACCSPRVLATAAAYAVRARFSICLAQNVSHSAASIIGQSVSFSTPIA